MKDDNQSFASVINNAMQLPDDTGEGATTDLPRLFQFPIPQNENVIDDEPVPDTRRIQGVPKYKFRAHFQRFIVGTIIREYGGQVTEDEHDDTVEYEEVQNMCLEGRAILCWEKPQFLKDGTVVIAMKWLTKHDKDEYEKLYGKPGQELKS